jgi:hypothetical protein
LLKILLKVDVFFQVKLLNAEARHPMNSLLKVKNNAGQDPLPNAGQDPLPNRGQELDNPGQPKVW